MALLLKLVPGEPLHIGHDVTVTVLDVQGKHVHVAIQAPKSEKILRGRLVGTTPKPKEPAPHA